MRSVHSHSHQAASQTTTTATTTTATTTTATTTTATTTGSDRLRVDVFCTLDRLFMAGTGWQPVMGAAQRRRERRLRSWYRHEQQTAWPLPRIRTTQLHGDRRWQGPGSGNEQYCQSLWASSYWLGEVWSGTYLPLGLVRVPRSLSSMSS